MATLSMQSKLTEMQHLNNCADLTDKATIYNTSSTQGKMLEAISASTEESVNILSSDFVGIIFDETTDLAVQKKLNIYFKTFKSGKYWNCDTRCGLCTENGKADITDWHVCSCIGPVETHFNSKWWSKCNDGKKEVSCCKTKRKAQSQTSADWLCGSLIVFMCEPSSQRCVCFQWVSDNCESFLPHFCCEIQWTI